MRLAAIALASLVLTLPSVVRAGPTTVAPWLEIIDATGSTLQVGLVQAAGTADVWTLDGGPLQIGSETDGGLLSNVQLRFDPDPFISASATLVDFGAPTQFIFSFFSPMLLGGTAYDYSLDGQLTVTTATGGTVTVDDIQQGGLDGLFFGSVDNTVVAASGAGGSGASPLVIDPAAVTGSASCTTCGSFSLGMGVGGAGAGATHQMTGNWTLTASTGNDVPEPGTLALLAAGFLAAATARSARARR
jgi:hypothetical protein